MSSKLKKKIINDLIEALFCFDTFTYPISSEYPDVHVVSKVKIIEDEIKKLKKKIKNLYGFDTFIPIIPKKGSEVYECQYKQIFGNITKLSEMIYYLKELNLNLDIKVLEVILEKEVEPDMEIDEDDIKKFNERMNLFDYLMIKKQRESYVKELGERQKQIQLMYNKINMKRDYVNELKNKPSYDLLSSLDGVNKVLRDQFEKKISIFIITFRNDLKKIKLSKEMLEVIKSNFKWERFGNIYIEKILDFICIILKDKLIKLNRRKLGRLLKKLNRMKDVIIKLINE
tara:strand:- start:182 stop:1039 length:858 start_codon:yes stop_codon:yes gene_type:complete